MRILVVAPQSTVFPIGIAYIIAVWKRAGHQVDAINLALTSEWSIAQGRYDLVATGGLACHYAALRDILSRVRASGVPSILGGGIVTSEPQLIAMALQPNYCVLGEGEEGAVELVAALEAGTDISKIPGIGFFRDGTFVMTEARKAIQSLNSLPIPDLDALCFDTITEHEKPSDSYDWDLFDFPRLYPLVGSRSCPYNCSFCYHPLGKKYRQRSVDNIISELAIVIPKYKINIIGIVDELFAAQFDRVREFCQRLKALLATIPWEVRWSCQLRVDRLTDELMATLKDSGCYLVNYGFESYSPVVLESMKKRIRPEQIRRAVDMTFAQKISLQANFIFGDKAETLETADETLRFWREYASAGIFLGFIHPYPNSELYQYCVKNGIIKDRIDFLENHLSDRINMTSMSDLQYFLLVTRVALHTLHYPPCATPKLTEPDRLVVQCPHCGGENDYKNYRVFDMADGIRGQIDRLLLNRVCHCRHCRLRFWSRTRLLRFISAVTRPLSWPGIQQTVFGGLYLTQSVLPFIRKFLAKGTLDKRHS